jgi:PTS system ascorbate-specific IIA component
MIGILIITHGSLGDSLIDCATHVLGTLPEQMASLAIATRDEPSEMVTKALALTSQLNTGDGVMVLSDMYGATPCNIVAKLLQPGVVEGVAGVNLPMLVRAITYRNESLTKLVEKAVSGGREGVVYFSREQCECYEAK